MAQTRYYSSTAQKTTLVDPVEAVDEVFTVAQIVGYPDSFPFTIIVDRDTIDEEVCEVSGVQGDKFTVTRGIDETLAVAHSVGAQVEHGVAARDFREADQHRSSSENVHGIELGSEVVGTTDTQTLYNKTIVGGELVPDPDVENPEIPMAGDVNMQGYRVMNLGDPQEELDAVSKKWVLDNTQQGVIDSEGSAELAKNWAIKMDGTVDGVDYSSKYHAAQSEQSADDSEQSAQDASEAWGEFASIYLGAHPTPPVSNEPGQLYWNTETNKFYVNDGSSWIEVSSDDSIKSMDVDQLIVMSWDDWQVFTAHESRTLYVVTADPALDPDEAYGTFWLGSLQIGGAGKGSGGGVLEGSPPPPVNVRWESDDPAVASYRKLMWDDGGTGAAGSTFGYAVLPANDAAKSAVITQTDNSATEAMVTGTQPGLTYEFQVYAANLAGPGERSPSVFRQFPGPEAPTNLRSKGGASPDAFKLLWDHGGQSQIVEDGAVTDYTVYCTDPSVVISDPNVSQKSATIDGATVVRDKTYTFTVSASSGTGGKDSGEGEESEAYQRQFDPPGMPYNLEVNGTTLSWEIDPVDTGPPTEYLFTFEYPDMSDGDPDNGIDPEPTDPNFAITWNGD